MTTKKYVSELNEKELMNVFNNNQKLQSDVHESMIDSEMHWISEHLDCIKGSLSDWSIGDSSYIYLKVDSDKIESFVDGVIKMQNDYGVLADNENDFIANIEENISLLNDTDMYSDEFDQLENLIIASVEILAEKIATHYKELFDSLYNEKYQFEYFTEFYMENRIDNKAYINTDQNDFILYEDVTQNYA